VSARYRARISPEIPELAAPVRKAGNARSQGRAKCHAAGSAATARAWSKTDTLSAKPAASRAAGDPAGAERAVCVAKLTLRSRVELGDADRPLLARSPAT